MKTIILFTILSGLLFRIAKTADPKVELTANPNSLTVGTPFIVKCHVENLDLTNGTVLIISYMFKPTDTTIIPEQLPAQPLAAWAQNSTDTFDFYRTPFPPEIGLIVSSVGEGTFPDFEAKIDPINEKAKGKYHCELKVTNGQNITAYESAVWSSSFAVVPSLIILVSCIIMALLRL